MATESRNGARRGHIRPVSPFYEELGKRLRETRRARRLSLDDVAERSGGRWNGAVLGTYERGQRRISIEDLRDLSEFYGVSSAVLMPEGEPDLAVLLRAVSVAGALEELLNLLGSMKEAEA